MDKKILVGIVMGSDSDLPVMQETAQILDKFAIYSFCDKNPLGF